MSTQTKRPSRKRTAREIERFLNKPREQPLTDLAFSIRRVEAQICTGSPAASIDVTARIWTEDYPSHDDALHVDWSVKRPGKPTRRSTDDVSFAADELEGFVTALFEAMRIAKERGLLVKPAI